MAVTQDIKTDRYGTPDFAPPATSQPMAASTKVYGGTIALLRNGYVVASDSPLTTDICYGIVARQTDNTSSSFFGGAQGAVNCDIDRGDFWLTYDTAHGFTQADVGKTTAYVKDAQTVSSLSTAGCVAGVVLAIDTSISKVAVALSSTPGTIF